MGLIPGGVAGKAIFAGLFKELQRQNQVEQERLKKALETQTVAASLGLEPQAEVAQEPGLAALRGTFLGGLLPPVPTLSPQELSIAGQAGEVLGEERGQDKLKRTLDILSSIKKLEQEPAPEKESLAQRYTRLLSEGKTEEAEKTFQDMIKLKTAGATRVTLTPSDIGKRAEERASGQIEGKIKAILARVNKGQILPEEGRKAILNLLKADVEKERKQAVQTLEKEAAALQVTITRLLTDPRGPKVENAKAFLNQLNEKRRKLGKPEFEIKRVGGVPLLGGGEWALVPKETGSAANAPAPAETPVPTDFNSAMDYLKKRYLQKEATD